MSIENDLRIRTEFMRLSCLISVVLVLELVGCASPKEIAETGKLVKFASTKPAAALASCINQNTDGAIGGSLVTSMKPLEPLKIVVRNANAVYAVIQIEEANQGSVAAFRLGLVASMAPQTEVERMTKGCN